MTRKAYKSDLNETEWAILESLLPAQKSGGRPGSVDLPEVANGIFYVLRTGCSWEMMPHDLPPSATCYHYFRRWQKAGVWQQMNNQLRGQVRQKKGKKAFPTAASADSQSVKTTEKRGRFMASMGERK